MRAFLKPQRQLTVVVNTGSVDEDSHSFKDWQGHSFAIIFTDHDGSVRCAILGYSTGLEEQTRHLNRNLSTFKLTGGNIRRVSYKTLSKIMTMVSAVRALYIIDLRCTLSKTRNISVGLIGD